MLTLDKEFRPQRVLAIGAHSDDIEIGCGGSILSLTAKNPTLEVAWVVLSADGTRRLEAEASARQFFGHGRSLTLQIEQFRERFFPHVVELKVFFDDLGRRHKPDLIFCPWIGDAHQDHRVVAELVQNTFRDNLILEYEIPKFDGDMGRPNTYIELTRETAERKVDLVYSGFPSQHEKRWFDREVFWALMRLRGMECASFYAEAFYCRKLKLISARPDVE